MILIQTKEKNAANCFGKDFFKLMNNSVHGKTMENLRKKINVRLIISAKDYEKYVSKPSFVSPKIFIESFVAIHETKPVLRLNKQIYVGFFVLDLSKYLMCDFYCNYIKRKHDAKLLLTNTATLAYEIKTNDVYDDFYKDKDLFDFSDYPQYIKFFDLANEKVIGKTKDEFKRKIMSLLDESQNVFFNWCR